MIKSIWTKEKVTPREYAKDLVIEHLKELLDYEPKHRKSPFSMKVYLKDKKSLSKKDREVIFKAIQEIYMDIRLKIYDPVMFR